MSKKFQNAFSRQEQNSMKRKKDYMKYAQSLECALQLAENSLFLLSGRLGGLLTD